MAGFIMSRVAADEAEILSVAVGRTWRGRGIAARLLSLHMRRLAGAGVATVFLEVGEANGPATALYFRAGFTEVSRRENYYDEDAGRATAALVLRRDLI
jgi:ribosomal-protein-alanine N-acetyltransferase